MVDISKLWLQVWTGDWFNGIVYFVDGTQRTFSGYTQADVINFANLYPNMIIINDTQNQIPLPTVQNCYSFQAYTVDRSASRSFRLSRLDYSALKLEFPNQVDSPFDISVCNIATETDDVNFARSYLSGEIISPPPTEPPTTEPPPTTPPPTIPIGCVVFTATADNGVSRFFQTSEEDYLQLLQQFRNNIGISESVPDCDARQDPIIVIDFLQTATPIPPAPPSDNYLVIISTQCGNLRAVFDQNNYDSWVSTNNTHTLCKIDPKLPCSLTYSLSGKVFEPDNWSSISQEIAVCYQATIPPTPLPNPTKGGSLTGITMLLLALGAMMRRG